ncbi:MAG: ABC transporter permease [Chloroflexi bacterium]|nr:ABC transporter permease [Chloroflexota bacterium]
MTWRRLPLVSGTILLFVLVAGIFAPLLAPHDPGAINIAQGERPPAWMEGALPGHILGTDQMGRDILSRLIWGARVSLIVGFSGIAIAGIVGSLLGLVSGYYGGWVDHVIMRVVDIQMSVPAILLALLLAAVLGGGLYIIIVVIAVVYWAFYARIVRGETLSVKARDFVALAKVAGCGTPRILLRHILPNVGNTIVVVVTLQLGSAIILEAALSFLGLGVQPPTAAWGLMLADGRTLLGVAWWIATWPGLAIMLTVLGANMLGEWLRVALDPKQRQV